MYSIITFIPTLLITAIALPFLLSFKMFSNEIAEIGYVDANYPTARLLQTLLYLLMLYYSIPRPKLPHPSVSCIKSFSFSGCQHTHFPVLTISKWDCLSNPDIHIRNREVILDSNPTPLNSAAKYIDGVSMPPCLILMRPSSSRSLSYVGNHVSTFQGWETPKAKPFE